MMLRHLGLEQQANIISKAVYDVLKEAKVRTADMGGEWIGILLAVLTYLESVIFQGFCWENSRSLYARNQVVDCFPFPSLGSATTQDFTKAIIAKF